MIQRLDQGDEEDPNRGEAARREFDATLGVTLWTSPLSPVILQVPTEGPWWWRGDEEASSSFLSEMGVTLD